MDYHDMLANLGIGSAHPGGMKSTLEWMNHVNISSDATVLDIGCGTGRTACHIQKLFDCKVVGIDIRPKMIQKANIRAKNAGAKVKFIQASVDHLPFADEMFDLCVTESVNVFVEPKGAVKEYFRVLKPNGTYVDVEMATFGPVTKEWRESVMEVYGACFVPDMSGWKRLYREAGFTNVETILTKPVNPDDGFDNGGGYSDPVQLADPGAYQDRKVISIMNQNSTWLHMYHRSLFYGIFKCSKSRVPE